ncbi:hypothetical protein P692DRAFT_20882338 [Suillus brevipes Sb2]|nr:hypothetical protein P692DRAFT_20882338 [Suillus brevipes Sb2]
MELSSTQLNALQFAQSILDDAGLSPCDLSDHSQTSFPPLSSYPSPDTSTIPLPLSAPDPCSTILAAQYIPPPAPDEISAGAIVEYPQTGSLKGNAVAHIFTITRDFDSMEFNLPQFNFQYSLGDGHGGLKGVQCFLLHDSMGTS